MKFFSKLGVEPSPRSLHTATIINNKMIIFGGWIPVPELQRTVPNQEKEWKCTNNYAILNLDSMEWEFNSMETNDESFPRARAGHSAVTINSRLYIWSGRDGYRKAWNSQVCCRDLWYLETEIPTAPVKIQLIKATTGSFDVTWAPIPNADCYLVQIQKVDETNITKKIVAVSKETTTATTTPVTTSVPVQVPKQILATTLNTQALTTTPIPSIGGTPSTIKMIAVTRAPVSAVVTGSNSTSMSGIATLASAAAGMPRICTKSLNPNIRIVAPAQTNPQTLKLATTSGSPQIRFFQPGKQIIFKTPTSSGALGNQIVTLIRSNNTTTAKSNSTTGGQFVKIVAQAPKTTTVNVTSTQSQPTGTTASTGSITSTTTVTTDAIKNSPQAKLINTANNVKMYVLPNRSQPLVIASNTQTGQTTQSPMIINKPIKIQTSALRPTVQGGSSKLVISSSTFPSNQIRLISNNQRLVLLQSTQALSSTTTVNTVNSTNAVSSSTNTLTNSNTNSVVSTANSNGNIPQSDGPSDEIEKETPAANSETPKLEQPVLRLVPADYFQTTSSNTNTTTTNTTNTTATNNNSKENNASFLKITDNWYDVGIFKTNQCSFSEFLVPKFDKPDNANISSILLPKYDNHYKIKLEAGCSYRFRVAALNIHGRGPWSDETSLRTSLPGYPPAPNSIKITKTIDGAYITWGMPLNSADNCHEYWVYLGVKDATTFNKVYSGPLREALITFDILTSAYIDVDSPKPAIIFRIAARNDKGFGPATQVRWILDSQTLNSNIAYKRPLGQTNNLE